MCLNSKVKTSSSSLSLAPPRLRKTVSFGDNTEVEVEACLSLVEREALWYNRNELLEYREKASSECPAASKSRRRHFRQALLSLQEELREMNMANDPKDLQVFASSHSRVDRKIARERAKEFSQEAGVYLGRAA